MSGAIEVAVNLLWIAPGRVGGSEEYLTRQLLGLDDSSIEPTIFCSAAFARAHPRLSSRFATVTSPGRRDSRGARIVAEHTWLAARTRSADLVHHGGGTAPLVGPTPFVLTVHDLQFRRFPDYFSRARREYLGHMMPRSVGRASVITTPSDYVRGTVIDAFGVDPDRVVVVPHGIPELERPDRDAVDDLRHRFGLGSRPFVVYPAITHPHKGHLVLLDMLDRVDPEIALVLIGGEGAAEPDVRSAAKRHGGRVLRAGRVDDEVRDALIADAEALVFPSEYEGFGAPLVEAMALGTPVVCSDAAALREVAADAAVVVTDRDGAAWADALGEAMERRDELVERGHRRRSAFTAEVSGRAIADAYRLAVDRGANS